MTPTRLLSLTEMHAARGAADKARQYGDDSDKSQLAVAGVMLLSVPDVHCSNASGDLALTAFFAESFRESDS